MSEVDVKGEDYHENLIFSYVKPWCNSHKLASSSLRELLPLGDNAKIAETVRSLTSKARDNAVTDANASNSPNDDDEDDEDDESNDDDSDDEESSSNEGQVDDEDDTDQTDDNKGAGQLTDKKRNQKKGTLYRDTSTIRNPKPAKMCFHEAVYSYGQEVANQVLDLCRWSKVIRAYGEASQVMMMIFLMNLFIFIFIIL